MQLKYRQYHNEKSNSSDIKLESSNNLTTSEFSEFVEYIEELMKLRGGEDGGVAAGGLVMAGVGNGQTTMMDLTEFIELVPRLKVQFCPPQHSISSPAPKG